MIQLVVDIVFVVTSVAPVVDPLDAILFVAVNVPFYCMSPIAFIAPVVTMVPLDVISRIEVVAIASTCVPIEIPIEFFIAQRSYVMFRVTCELRVHQQN